MPDGVNIPVRVTGADEAVQDLERVDQAVRGAGAANAAAAAGGAESAAANRNLVGSSEQVAAATSRVIDAEGRVAAARQTGVAHARALAAAEQEQARARAQLALGGPWAAEDAQRLREAAGQIEGYGAKAEQAGKQQKLFNESAKTALTGLLGRLSPELASLANVAVDMAKGIGSASLALLGLVGAGAAVGGIVALFRNMREAAAAAEAATRRMLDATRQARSEGAQTRERLAREAAGLGMAGVAGDVQAAAAALQRDRGVPADMAQSAALAQAFAGAQGMEFDLNAYLAGMVVAGAKPPEFKGPSAARSAIRYTVAAGRRPGGAEALAAFLRDVGVGVMSSAPPSVTEQVDPQDAALARVLGEHPELSPDERNAIERIVRARMVEEVRPRSEQSARRLARRGQPVDAETLLRHDLRNLAEARGALGSAGLRGLEGSAGLGGAATMGEIVDLAIEAAERAASAAAPGGPAGAAQSVTFNVHYQTINVDHMTLPSGPSAAVQAAELVPGLSVVD